MNLILTEDHQAGLREVSPDQLREVIARHELWLRSNHVQGERAELQEISSTELGILSGDLRGANFAGSRLFFESEEGRRRDGIWFLQAKLGNADLRRVDLTGAFINGTDLRGADLRGAILSGAQLIECDLREAKLTKANLMGASLLKCNLQRASLSGASVYGLSAWDLNTSGLLQRDLVITYGGPTVTVDNLEVAQFVHLLLKNQKIRGVIDAISRKGVLILGRFYDERKAVLDALRDRLRDFDLVPMVFDFDKPSRRDLTETVQLLANMSRFVIADVTDAKSIPQELSHIIPFLPSVPVRPIILDKEYEYSMFEHWDSFDSVLDVYRYQDGNQLTADIRVAIIEPVEKWEQGFDERKALRDKAKVLEEENRALQAELRELRSKREN